ncbi:MAG: urease accessory protein UreE [Pseudomonadales bacterium]|jgi:urease accessory protein|nr:urease accessory protein UreE [Pseudomonadales bacterium]
MTDSPKSTAPPRALRVAPAGSWSGEALDVVCLDFDQRHRRRVRLVTEGGVPLVLDLPEVPSLAEGDALELEDGRRVRVRCAEEALLEVRADDGAGIARLAWHLGNRHLPTEIAPDRLRIRMDHVIEEMLLRLGASVRRIQAPFHPEGGAYGHGRTHGHSHGDDPSAGDRTHDHAH